MAYLPKAGSTAYACALEKLGYKCEGEDVPGRVMKHHDTGKVVVVPALAGVWPKSVVKQLVDSCGYSREHFLVAFRDRMRTIDCPQVTDLLRVAETLRVGA